MKWKVINASVRGSAHQRSGLPNQDAVDYAVPKMDAAATVLAVSDGHGSGRHFRSQVGSTLAVHVAVKVVQDALSNPKNEDGYLTLVGQEVVEAWIGAVRSDLKNNPFTETELGVLEAAEGERSRILVVERPELAYGATLLVAAVTDSRIVFLQLGDGDILAVSANGTTTRPIVADERLVGNQTTSLCQPEAWREFRVADVKVGAGSPVLILLSTDGYMNSFRSHEDFLQIGNDYLQILREQGSETLAEELPRILSEATHQGSGDDITLGILHAEVLPTAASVRDKLASTAPAASQSVMIRELTSERNTQQKKLSELESNFQGVRRHVLQLRLLTGLALLAVILGVTQQYWFPLIHQKHMSPKPPVVAKEPNGGAEPEPQGRPKKGEDKPAKQGPVDDPSPVPNDPDERDPSVGKPKAGTPKTTPNVVDGQWTLVLGDGKQIVLSEEKTITSAEVVPGGDKHPYARVKKRDNILVLTNLSSDAWTVTSGVGGKRRTFSEGDSVPVRIDTTIIFHKSITGSLKFLGKSS